MKNNIIHISLAIVLTALLFMLTDPFMFWMPSMVAMTVLFIAVVLLGVWTGFIMKEQVRDERELMHRMYSGRIAYLSGLLVLTVALVIQGFSHHIDPWIAGALWVMVISKLVARLYFEKYR